MKEIKIKHIPYNKMRYGTVGDYIKTKNGYDILVSKQKGYVGTEDELKGVALHELIEMWLCLKRGIKLEDIDKWDISYKGSGEPGEVKSAPYYKEHAFATKIEKLFLKEMKK